MARPHRLADPDFALQVAELYAAGCTRDQMCEALGVRDPKTISRWVKDPRVKINAMKIVEDRVLQVTRKVDSTIAGRLEHTEKMTVQELLSIRKEYLGGAARQATEKADADTVNEAASWLEADPARALALQEMLESGNVPGAVAPEEPQDPQVS